MAKIYDVYDDFNEEMKNISHFFNLNYNEKKISNEEFIFNFLEQQLAEQKIANCVNSLKEQNKISKKDENQKKDERDYLYIYRRRHGQCNPLSDTNRRQRTT